MTNQSTPQPAAEPVDGYAVAFYEIADMLGIGARPLPPATIWRDEMRPALIARLAARTRPAARVNEAEPMMSVRDIFNKAALQANQNYGQRMPKRWLELFWQEWLRSAFGHRNARAALATDAAK